MTSRWRGGDPGGKDLVRFSGRQPGTVDDLHLPAPDLDQAGIGPLPQQTADDLTCAPDVRCQLLVRFPDDAVRIGLDQ